MFRAYFCLWIQALFMIPGYAKGAMYSIRDPTWVSSAQGKSSTHCTMNSA